MHILPSEVMGKGAGVVLVDETAGEVVVWFRATDVTDVEPVVDFDETGPVRLVTDHHPADRGPKGTHAGAILANRNLYCPCTPPALLTIGPLARRAIPDETAAHDTTTAEAARYKLGRQSADDADGYHRVGCPALAGKLRRHRGPSR